MMGLTARNSTTVTVDPRGLRIAEVRVGKAQVKVLRSARFDLPEGVQWQMPDAATGLTAFLRQGGWGGGNAVLGLGAEQCLFNLQTIPAVKSDQVAAAIAIQAERLFATSAVDLAIDHTPPARGQQGITTLFAATARQRLTPVVAGLSAAGVKVRHATPQVVALAHREPGEDDWIGLYVANDAAELVFMRAGQPTMIIPVNSGAALDLASLEVELRQAVMLASSANGDRIGRVVLWNDSDVDSGQVAAVAEAHGLPCEIRDQRDGLVMTALAETAARSTRPLIDFLHPRIAAQPRRRLSRRILWAAAVVATLVFAAAALTLDLWGAGREVESLSEQLSSMSADLDEAQALIAHTAGARQWFDRNPRFLECQRSLAEAFGDDGRVWAGSIALRVAPQDQMTGLLTGNAVGEGDVFDLLDRLKQLSEMPLVTLTYVRETGSASNEVGFAIRFTFDPGRTRP